MCVFMVMQRVVVYSSKHCHIGFECFWQRPLTIVAFVKCNILLALQWHTVTQCCLQFLVSCSCSKSNVWCYRWWSASPGKSSHPLQCMWFVCQIFVCPSTYRSLDWLYNQVINNESNMYSISVTAVNFDRLSFLLLHFNKFWISFLTSFLLNTMC